MVAIPSSAQDAASGPGRRTNLPIELTTFVGRQHEVVHLAQLLHNRRLLTLIGTGGVVKTRLALKLAAEVALSYDDGVYLVELAGLSHSDLVVQAVASSLGIIEQHGRTPLATLLDARCAQAARRP